MKTGVELRMIAKGRAANGDVVVADRLARVAKDCDRLEQENAELRKQLKDSHEWLGINSDYWGTPLCVNNEKLLNK